MAITEEDKDVIIKVLCRAIIALEENKQLRKIIKSNNLNQIKQKTKPIKQESNTNELLFEPTTTNIKIEDDWNKIQDGSFDEEIKNILNNFNTNNQDKKAKESDEDDEEKR